MIPAKGRNVCFSLSVFDGNARRCHLLLYRAARCSFITKINNGVRTVALMALFRFIADARASLAALRCRALTSIAENRARSRKLHPEGLTRALFFRRCLTKLLVYRRSRSTLSKRNPVGGHHF